MGGQPNRIEKNTKIRRYFKADFRIDGKLNGNVKNISGKVVSVDGYIHGR
jgi:cytoskeletal protein CcmA (bactofilin family)